jgi:F0F1-type ATP synthase membrane subunit b/b'
MYSTSFAYLISFLIFLFFAYRLGFQRAKTALRTEVAAISNVLDEASKSKEMALLSLNELKYQLSEAEKHHSIFMENLQKRGEEITQKHTMDIKILIQEKENHHRELLHQELRLHKDTIQQEIIGYVLNDIKTRVESSPYLQNVYKEKAQKMLTTLSS